MLEVAFDPEKSQVTEFVRVRVRFDVSKPVRRAKKITFKEGTVNILYDFERIQKRCFFCQRLTHEQENCPLKAKDLQDKKLAAKQKGKGEVAAKEKVIKESDPLFGVVEENQVGLDPSTGRERIAKEVIEGMRQYLLVANGAELLIRKERIKKSLMDLSNDPIGQKTMLRLEPYPVVSSDINKEKGVVFNYGDNLNPQQMQDSLQKCQSQLVSGVSSLVVSGQSSFLGQDVFQPGEETRSFKMFPPSFNEIPTVYKAGLFEAGPSSGLFLKNGKPRKRLFKSRRKKKESMVGSIQQMS